MFDGNRPQEIMSNFSRQLLFHARGIACLLLPLIWMTSCTRSGGLTLRPGFVSKPTTIPQKIVVAARRQAQEHTSYMPGYVVIAYPGGDVPRGQGVCTDVIIRSLWAVGLDLQVLIHKDMKAHFSQYPHKWGLTRPDTNIDHRRVPNQMTYFKRHGRILTTVYSDETKSQWGPGDLVYWDLGHKGLLHCGVVSDTKGWSGVPLVIHNLGGCREEDVLLAWKTIGHYRYPVQ